MKYYSISWDEDIKVVGSDPQVEFKKGYNPTIDGVYNMHPHEFPSFSPNLELKLHKKAKITTYLHSYIISYGMIINGDFKKVLEKFNLPPHAFYPIKVYDKSELLDYYWFHFIVKDFWEWLDKDESKAIIYDDKDDYVFVSEVNLHFSLNEIKKIDDALPWYQHMKWEKIVFKSDFPKYDIYKTQHIGFMYVISERLLDALKETGMTGFVAEPYDIIECK